MHCSPEVVEDMPVELVERMGDYLHLEALNENWRYEQNQDLYVGVARKLRKDQGRVCENPDDEESNVEFEAKQLALKDAAKRKAGESRTRASDAGERERPPQKSFGKKG